MNLNSIFDSIKIASTALFKILQWVGIIAFLYSSFFTQEKVFAIFVCLILIIWFFIEYFKINQASNHARKKYDLYDPALWKLEEKLNQRFWKALGWAFLGGLGAMIIVIWKILRQ